MLSSVLARSRISAVLGQMRHIDSDCASPDVCAGSSRLWLKDIASPPPARMQSMRPSGRVANSDRPSHFRAAGGDLRLPLDSNVGNAERGGHALPVAIAATAAQKVSLLLGHVCLVMEGETGLM